MRISDWSSGVCSSDRDELDESAARCLRQALLFFAMAAQLRRVAAGEADADLDVHAEPDAGADVNGVAVVDLSDRGPNIGRAPCRESGGQDGCSTGCSVSCKKTSRQKSPI